MNVCLLVTKFQNLLDATQAKIVDALETIQMA
jgi:hypothetical protein